MKYEIEVKDKNAKYIDSKCVVSLIAVDGKSTMVIPIESVKPIKIWRCSLCGKTAYNRDDMPPGCNLIAKLVAV